jgi:membrane protease YdiL (CAAX protease family)
MGWQLAPWQFEVAAFLMPVVYACCAYLPVWLSGVGGFPNPDFFSAVSAKFPQLPLRLATAVDVVWISSFAMIPAGFAALGEEIGWRGYLVPQLVATTSKLNTAWISRIVWAVWHYPAILFTGYNNGLPIPYAITCFTIMVIGFAFIMTWFRLRSGSIWPCVILHASHNNFIALFFTPVTTEKHLTKYFIDEFGAVTIPLAAFILWRWQQPTDTDAALVPG